jgi:hypothetical protein
MLKFFKSFQNFTTYQRDKAFTDKQYYKFMHKKMNWKSPKTLNEKIQIWKLSKEMETLWPYADKLEVRKIVEKRVGSNILNKIYGIWNNVSDIDFGGLPNQFVLKTNHGSAMYVIVKDKKTMDVIDIQHKLNYWLNINYYKSYGRERQYKFIKPKIFAEKYLEDKNGKLLDYKFFCFGGKVAFIHLTIDRFSKNKRKNFYDMNWKKLPFTLGPLPDSKKKFPKPKNFAKMIEIAEKLSSGLKLARIDLYNVDGKIYFGEITLTPGNGMDIFHPLKYDLYYGSLLKL